MPVRKRFGQHFLRDRSVIDRIVHAMNPRPGEPLIEIGPGDGALTRRLADSGCDLTVIEVDFDLVAELRAHFADSIRIIQGDVLKVDFAGLLDETGPARIVGNLPYNISTPLLFRLFSHMDRIIDMHFMLQLEVVDRINARPSTAEYGRLSVMCQYYCDTTRLFKVSPAAFVPRPKVTSAVIRLEPGGAARPRAQDTALLEKILARAFSQRRKTIRNAMKPWLSAGDFEALALDPGLRPENLTLAQFVACANHVSAREGAS